MIFCRPAAYWSLCLYGLGVGLLTRPALGSDPPVVLGQLTRNYNGSPVLPEVTTNPAGLPVTLVYRDLSSTAPPGELQVVFNNTPEVLPLSYSSLSFAGGVSALGNYVRLGGAARKLDSCEVILVNWARASQYPGWAAINPAGYAHPVTMTLYSLTPANLLTPLAEVTKTIIVPWRPEVLSNGQPYPFNGFAFRASFAFPGDVILPEQVMLVVDYSTESTGFSPIGQPGPYNQLNVALDGEIPAVGVDVDEDVVLRMAGDTWFYPNTGWSGFNGPMTKLRSRSTVTKMAPIAPGTYQVTATAGATGTEGSAQGILTIIPPSFSAWVNTEFTEAQRTDSKSAPHADPDGDGLTNLMEFALGTQPNSTTTAPPWILDPAVLTITLDRPRWLTGVSYFAEESSDMAQWFPVPLVVVSSTSTRETVRASASQGAAASARTFLRIRFAE